MIQIRLIAWLFLLGQLPAQISEADAGKSQFLDKSAYFAYVDREFIFTIEIVKPGVPLFNFVSMVDNENRLIAENIRLTLGNRKSSVKLFAIETSDFQRPMSVVSIVMHPRSSFGFRLDGNFGNARELYGATIRMGKEDFGLVPLTQFDFELLVQKVNRINLGSPDFSEDWRVLRLEVLGSRSAARK